MSDNNDEGIGATEALTGANTGDVTTKRERVILGTFEKLGLSKRAKKEIIDSFTPNADTLLDKLKPKWDELNNGKPEGWDMPAIGSMDFPGSGEEGDQSMVATVDYREKDGKATAHIDVYPADLSDDWSDGEESHDRFGSTDIIRDTEGGYSVDLTGSGNPLPLEEIPLSNLAMISPLVDALSQGIKVN